MIGKRASATTARAHRRARRGMTIIEMMVTVTITLILMGAVMAIFGMIAGAVRDNQARMEVVDRLKGVTARLQADLQGRTALTLPWNRIESASGYFLYAEGPASDVSPDDQNSWLQVPKDTTTSELVRGKILGDMDDVLAMTVRSRGAPFIGRGPDTNKPLESYLAEIVWFVRPAETNDSENKPLTLYRRVLLIVSEEQMQGASGTSQRDFFEKYDISARLDRQSGRMVPNTLADLTMPENRFSHTTGNVGRLNLASDSPMRPFPLSSERYGEDVMLTNIVGFDIKAFDPWASFAPSAGGEEDSVALVPGDFQYGQGGQERGVYVDIGGPGGGDYGGRPREESRLNLGTQIRGLFDTWSFHYEHDGISQAGAEKDGATDLLDGNGTGGVDDGSEREVCAPYLRPLRGLQVTVRCYEPRSRQVEQVTLASDFMPR